MKTTLVVLSSLVDLKALKFMMRADPRLDCIPFLPSPDRWDIFPIQYVKINERTAAHVLIPLLSLLRKGDRVA